MKKHSSVLFLAIVVIVQLLVGTQVNATPLLGITFHASSLFDIDPESAAMSNPRRVDVTSRFAGLEYVDGKLVGLTWGHGGDNDNSLVTIDPSNGRVVSSVKLVGISDVSEGGLGYDSVTGVLYGYAGEDTSSQSGRGLVTIDPTTGATDFIGTIEPFSVTGYDISGLAFDSRGIFYAVSAGHSGDQSVILTLDPSDASVTSETNLGADLGGLVGFDIDPLSGRFHVTDQEAGLEGGRNVMFIVNPMTGEMSAVGSLSGLAGIVFVPEPSTALLLSGGIALLAMMRRHMSN